ncbi:MAG: hypothetical protein FJ278_11780 [Planctomycetes bacterium]|nr:hypothetical protein [Planctomycetota bacterium]
MLVWNAKMNRPTLFRRRLLPVASAALCVSQAALSAAPLAIETTLVDSSAISFGTFQSHNQKVVHNARGIFMTHVRSRNDAYTAQQWRLSWSRDGGRTFTTLFEATDATNPPVLETDSAGNLYLGRPDFVSLEVLLYRFLAAEDYREPHITRVPRGSAGKFAMALDEPRRQVYYFSHNNSFHRFALDGAVLGSANLLRPGDKANLQYPLLQLDGRGVLHAAWTTEAIGRYLYWDIHYLQSPDGGATWRAMAGQPVTLPVIADHGGLADRITLDDEFEVHTWLSSFLIKGGKAHFLYLARTEPVRQHYVRYDLATGQRDFDRQPEFRGDKLAIRNLDGFFATRSESPNSPLFCISRDERDPRLVCLASDDNGATWRDHAVSAPFKRAYSIGGCREVTPDGWIIGSFTDVTGEQKDGWPGGRVHFFRIPATVEAQRTGG